MMRISLYIFCIHFEGFQKSDMEYEMNYQLSWEIKLVGQMLVRFALFDGYLETLTQEQKNLILTKSFSFCVDLCFFSYVVLHVSMTRMPALHVLIMGR